MNVLTNIKFTSVTDQEPPKDKNILAMNFRNGCVHWIASIWYHGDSDTWVCDFTDNEFRNNGYHSFTHWIIIDNDQ